MKDRQKVSAVFLVANDMSLRVCNTATGYVMCQDIDGLTLLFVCELLSSRARGCDTQQRNKRHLRHSIAEIRAHLCAQYADNAVSQNNINEYTEIFKKGWTSANDAKCSGYPSKSITTEKLQEAVVMVLRDGSYCHRNLKKIKYQPRVTIFNSV
jgi:hypothetical protein